MEIGGSTGDEPPAQLTRRNIYELLPGRNLVNRAQTER